MLPLLTAAWFAQRAEAGCDPTGLDAALDAADRAFLTSDPKAMSVAIGQVRKSLSCARVAVAPETCARVHRARALDAWLAADPDGALGSLRGMLHADPRAVLTPPVIPERHELRDLLVTAEESPPSWTEAPGGGWVLVDGLRTGAIPVGQPYVLQPLKSDGQFLGARIVDRPAAAGTGRAAPGATRGRAALRWTGIGLGVVSAGLYGAAWMSNAAYQDAVLAADNPRIGAYHTTTNALSIGSVASLSIGFGAVLGAQAIR